MVRGSEKLPVRDVAATQYLTPHPCQPTALAGARYGVSLR
jgi:hypothetical protein